MPDKKSKLDGKTSRPDFDRAKGGGKPKQARNYSHGQLVSKIDRYASVAKTGKQKKDMLGLKEGYEQENERKAMNRGARDEHFRQGQRAGIHQMDTLQGLHGQDRETDQRDRNRTAKEAKRYYHRNYSLSKSHREAASKGKGKDITVDKG